MRITVGAIAPGEVVELDLSAPPGVDFMAATRAVKVTLEQTDEEPSTLAPWTTVSVSSSLWTVRFSPTGDDFVAVGPCRLIPDLTLDGVLYRYAAVRGDIISR